MRVSAKVDYALRTSIVRAAAQDGADGARPIKAELPTRATRASEKR